MEQRVAISIWGDRISPVMDTAGQILVIDYDDDRESNRQLLLLPQFHFIHKADFMKNNNIDILICGAISRRMQQILIASKIEVIPFIRGSIDSVIEAFQDGEIQNGNFFLPGCGRNFAGQKGQRCRRRGNYFRGRGE